MKVYVWTLPTRIFHTLLVLFTLGAYITAEWDDLLTLHVALGASLGILLLYRVIWGVIGPKYSLFSDFNLNITALKEYLFSLSDPKKKVYRAQSRSKLRHGQHHHSNAPACHNRTSDIRCSREQGYLCFFT